MKTFEENDIVYIKNEFCYGKVVDVREYIANVEFTTTSGGGCLPFDFFELSPVWCITTNYFKDEDIQYLGWQHPAWDEDGYFWTAKENIKEVLPYNTPEHPFLFHSRNAAIKCLKRMNISQRCKVIIF